MFTGIVTAVGTIAASEQRGDLRLRIAGATSCVRWNGATAIASSAAR